MAVVAKLEILTVANTGGLAKSFAKGTAEIKGFAKSLFGINLAANLASRGISTVVNSVMEFGRSMLQSIGQAQEFIDTSNKTASALNFSTKAYVGLQHGALLSGLAAEQFRTAMAKMTDTIGEALGGNEAAAETFTELGLSVQSLGKMSGEQRLMAIADAVQKLGWNARTAAAMADIFGRRMGPDMLQLLGDGSKGLQEFMAMAERLGITFDEVAGAKVEAANDAWENFKAALSGVAQEIAINVSPALLWFSEGLATLTSDANAFGHAMRVVFGWVSAAAMFMGKMIARVAQFIAAAFTTIEAISASAFSGIIEFLNLVGAVSDATMADVDARTEETFRRLDRLITGSWADDLENSFKRSEKQLDAMAEKVVETRSKLRGLELSTGTKAAKAVGGRGGMPLQPAFAEKGSMEAAKLILDAQAAMRGGPQKGNAAEQEAVVLAQKQVEALNRIERKVGGNVVLQAAGL